MAGDTAIYVNPMQAQENEMMYENLDKIVSIADKAISYAANDNMSQSIVLSGKSGSGKTELAKVLIQRLLTPKNSTVVAVKCTFREGYQPLGSKANPLVLPVGESKVHRAVVAAVATLDMFGMAPTAYAVATDSSSIVKDFHPNSSRHARLFSFTMDPDNDAVLKGFHVDSAALDTLRLHNFKDAAFAPYRVFGCLVSSLSTSASSTSPPVDITPTQVQQVMQHFSVDTGINHGNSVAVHMAAEFAYFRRLLMDGADVTAAEWDGVVNCLAAVVQLQAITVTGSDSTPGRISNAANSLCVANAEALLNVPAGSMVKMLTQYANPASPSVFIDYKKFEVIAQIDGMCVEIYQRVMCWLLDKCNAAGANPSVGVDDVSPPAFRIIDLMGWENHENNINGFAQLFANAQMERLNQMFSAQCFQMVVNAYLSEGIPIDDKLVVVPSIAPLIELYETSVTGIFSSLESICILPKGDDKAFAEKLEQNHGSKSAGLITFLPAGNNGSASVSAAKYSNAIVPRPGSTLSSRPAASSTSFSTMFSVNHSFGEVTYDLDKFVVINRSYASQEVLKALNDSASTNPHLICLKAGKDALVCEEEQSPSAAPTVGSVKSKFAAFSASKAAAAIPIRRGNLFLTRAKNSFDAVMDAVDTTKCHFIQCIRPGINPANGVVSLDDAFNNTVVATQVKGLYVVELCMLNKAASYPYQASYHDFFSHFRPMLPATVQPPLPWLIGTSDDVKCNTLCRDLFKRILLVSGLPDIAPITAGMQVAETGHKREMVPVFAKNKIFMKNAIFTPLNSFRNDLLDRMMMAGVLIQRLYRLWQAYKIIKFKILLPYKHLRPAFYDTITIARKSSMKYAFKCFAATVQQSRTLVIQKSFLALIYMNRLRQRYGEIRMDMAARLIQNTFNKKFIYQIKFRRLKRAARMLQFLAKGYSVRRETMNIIYAARCIRKNAIIFGLKLRNIKRRSTAAWTIQRIYRGWYEREKFSRIVRILAAKKRLRTGRKCILKLQAVWRQRRIYQRYATIRWAARVLQQWARTLQYRHRFLLICMLAQWLQTHARRLMAARRVRDLRSIAMCASEKQALVDFRREELLSSNISMDNLLLNNRRQEFYSPGGTVMDNCIIGEGVLKDGQLFYSRCVAAVDIVDYSVTQAYPEGWLAPMRKFAHELKVRDKKHIAHVAIGNLHTIVVDADSNIYSMGSSEFGQLGHGNRKNVSYGPKLILGLRETLANADGTATGAARGASIPVRPIGGAGKQQFAIKQVACGPNYTMILSAAGKVFSWGSNDRGQLGYGDFQDAVSPHCINALKNIAKIACGAGHAAALTHTGAVYTWGAWDCIGRALGRDASYTGAQPTLFSKSSTISAAVSVSEPAPLPKMNRRVSIFLAKKNQEEADARAKSQKNMIDVAKANASTNANALAKRRASTTTIAGNKVSTSTVLDANKVLHTDTCEPGLVSYFQHRGIKALVCGDTCTTVLHVDGKYGGTIYCWGKNTRGEIGQGAAEPQIYVLPKRVASLPAMKETDALMSTLYCGGNTVGFLLKGKLFMWGWNKYGQIGAGPYYECVYEPMQVPVKMSCSSEIITHVTLNRRQSVAMTNYGAVHIWGYMNSLFENPVGTYNAALENVGTPASTSFAASTRMLFGSMDQSKSIPASPTAIGMQYPRGRAGYQEITATSDDLSKCNFTPTLWSSNAGMVDSLVQSATGVSPHSPAKRIITRPSELSSACVSNSGREGGYGAIFALLPGAGVCSSSTMSVLAFDRIKGIAVDPQVLQELSGKRFVSQREVAALPGQFHTNVIGSGTTTGVNTPMRSHSAVTLNENNLMGLDNSIGGAKSNSIKQHVRPGTGTSRPGTTSKGEGVRPLTSTGVSREAPRTTTTTAMHILGGKALVSDVSRANGEFQAEMSRRFKESLTETIAGKVVRRFSRADSLTSAAESARNQAVSGDRGSRGSASSFVTVESDILREIATNKPAFRATASTPTPVETFNSSMGGTTVGVKGYDRSREGKLTKSSVTELLVPTKSLSIGTSVLDKNSSKRVSTTALKEQHNKNKTPFSNSRVGSRAAPKESLLTSFTQKLQSGSARASSNSGADRVSSISASVSKVTVSSSKSKETASLSRQAAVIPKMTAADILNEHVRAAEAEMGLMYRPGASTLQHSPSTGGVGYVSEVSGPDSESVPLVVDATGPEWMSSSMKKKSVMRGYGDASSVYTANTASSKTSSTGATINTYTNYNYNVNRQKQGHVFT